MLAVACLRGARPIFALVLVASLFATPAAAAGATCQDFIKASGENQALYYGFILGFVSAKLEGHKPVDVEVATRRVRDLTQAYCREQPQDSFAGPVAVYADTVAHFTRDQRNKDIEYGGVNDWTGPLSETTTSSPLRLSLADIRISARRCCYSRSRAW